MQGLIVSCTVADAHEVVEVSVAGCNLEFCFCSQNSDCSLIFDITLLARLALGETFGLIKDPFMWASGWIN